MIKSLILFVCIKHKKTNEHFGFLKTFMKINKAK